MLLLVAEASAVSPWLTSTVKLPDVNSILSATGINDLDEYNFTWFLLLNTSI